MKTFNAPYIEVIKFAIADVITTSGEEEPDAGGNGMGWG